MIQIHTNEKAQKNGYNGPVLGVKLAEKNEREFTEEQLRAGEAVIGLQGKQNKNQEKFKITGSNTSFLILNSWL